MEWFVLQGSRAGLALLRHRCGGAQPERIVLVSESNVPELLATFRSKLCRSKLMELSGRPANTGSHQLTCWAGALYQASRCQGKAKAIPVVRCPTGNEVHGLGTS